MLFFGNEGILVFWRNIRKKLYDTGLDYYAGVERHMMHTVHKDQAKIRKSVETLAPVPTCPERYFVQLFGCILQRLRWNRLEILNMGAQNFVKGLPLAAVISYFTSCLAVCFL